MKKERQALIQSLHKRIDFFSFFLLSGIAILIELLGKKNLDFLLSVRR